MDKALVTVRAIHRTLGKFTFFKSYICGFLLIIMTAITFTQVTMRYAFKSPIIGAEEATLLLLVWFGFLCISLDIHTDSHAALYFLYNKLPPLFKKMADLMRHAALTWFFVAMFRQGWRITSITMSQILPATGVPNGFLFAPLVVGGVFMALYSVVNFFDALFRPLDKYRQKNQDRADVIESIDNLAKERGGTV